jgi:acyl-homoserine-lactone acylase
MRFLGVFAVIAVGVASSAFAEDSATRWDQEAAETEIIRDDWGIAHIHGKTDADAVFGMSYAQAQDDFNRVETNYITGLGRTAETKAIARSGRIFGRNCSSIRTCCKRTMQGAPIG